MGQAALPEWESELVEETIRAAEERLRAEQEHARRRAVQLAREQAYHRLAAAIDRSKKTARDSGQLSLFPEDPTLFDDVS